MKKVLFFVVFIMGVWSTHNRVSGQVQYGLYVIDSTSFTFGSNDSLHHHLGPYDSASIDTSHTDTTNTFLWQIGHTIKYFFADSGNARGIMTDTINEYPVNANSWFVLKYNAFYNKIVSFRHKYQATANRDGGIVEYSTDTGKTWYNVLDSCTAFDDWTPGIHLDTFYGWNDTLLSGEHAFTGTSNGWRVSKIQFFAGLPAKNTGGFWNLGCAMAFPDFVELRFRFKSDSIPDTLDGWIIGSINIEQDFYGGSVPKVNKSAVLNIYPNPSMDAIFNFPNLDEEKGYSIEILNAIGCRLLRLPYKHEVNLSGFPKGLYFYRVSNGEVNYNGKLVVE